MRSPTPGRRGRLCAPCGDAGAVATLAVMAAPTEVEIEANGLRFDTLLAGPEDGEAVILLHGYPQSAAPRRETMEWLADRGYRARRKRSDRNAGRRRSSSAGGLVTSSYPVTPASEACHDARCVERESAVGKPADFVNGPSSHAALRPRLTTGLLFSPAEANRPPRWFHTFIAEALHRRHRTIRTAGSGPSPRSPVARYGQRCHPKTRIRRRMMRLVVMRILILRPIGPSRM
jgi:hypothetical protein